MRYLLRSDPHYGIRGLLLFPNGVQRFIVNRVYRRSIRRNDGVLAPAYDVEHTYWHAREIAKCFPGKKQVEVVYSKGFNPPGRYLSAYLQRPSLVVEQIRYEMRFFFFDHLLIYKGQRPANIQAHDLLTKGA